MDPQPPQQSCCTPIRRWAATGTTPLVVAVAEQLTSAGVAALRVDLRDPDVEGSGRRLQEIAAELLAKVGVDRLLLVATRASPASGRRRGVGAGGATPLRVPQR